MVQVTEAPPALPATPPTEPSDAPAPVPASDAPAEITPAVETVPAAQEPAENKAWTVHQTAQCSNSKPEFWKKQFLDLSRMHGWHLILICQDFLIFNIWKSGKSWFWQYCLILISYKCILSEIKLVVKGRLFRFLKYIGVTHAYGQLKETITGFVFYWNTSRFLLDKHCKV